MGQLAFESDQTVATDAGFSDHRWCEDLCLELLHAETESSVVDTLASRGLWDNHDLWRDFGDREDNFSVIGNQQSRPEAALVEKVVNSVDARLLAECLAAGIDPESEDAPESVREAVARFFEGRETCGERDGRIRDWEKTKRTEVSLGITIAATGSKTTPCFTIADVGEGQMPQRMPDTLLSLDKKNKLRIQFVQGKFNMGGTGVLKFCGAHNLQLVISKRLPEIVGPMNDADDSFDEWGFTIVRRQAPKGHAKNSVYTYLAPLEAHEQPSRGNVLRFRAESLHAMPSKNSAYARPMSWGTVIKLYEYQAPGFRSHVLRKDGLLGRLELLLPEIGLPVRIHECRSYGGHEGSFDTTMTGLGVRLEDKKQENIEPDYPTTVPFKIASGEEFSARIYAFKRGRADAYRKNEGIILTVNGQTHGYLPISFFGRKRVQMGYLSDSLLVFVDCTRLSNRAREDLFMNSRDRLSGGDLRVSLEEELEDLIHNHKGLRELRDRRRQEETESSLAESKPLEEVLKSILKSSPSLTALFTIGSRLPSPHKSATVSGDDKPFTGCKHPTFFRFRRRDYGEVLQRSCPINRRARIEFETDVENDYFDRKEESGRFELELADVAGLNLDAAYSLNLYNGVASLNLSVPQGVAAGDELGLYVSVNDDCLVEPYLNVAELTVTPEQDKRKGGNGRHRQAGKDKGDEAEKPLGIELPRIVRVKEDAWAQYGFNRYSACRIRQAESEVDQSKSVYDFDINIDNVYLQTDVKASREAPALQEARFIYGTVLIGLALIRDWASRENDSTDIIVESRQDEPERESIEQRVAAVTAALAPFILPMISSLGAMSLGDVSGGHVGDDE